MKRLRYDSTLVCIAVVIFTLTSIVLAQDKKTLSQSYKGKYVVVLKEGLAVGLCSELPPPTWTAPVKPVVTINISNGIADLTQRGTFLNPLAPSYGCTSVPETIHKGEVLKVESAGIVNVYGRKFVLNVTNISPHAVQRGTGAFEHQSLERGYAVIIFKLDEKDDAKEPAQAAAFASDWFKVFDTQDAAANFGNTASGAFVREIKAGMTMFEVESVLGPPQTKVSLTEKILYKYKDMIVEFRDGKVADVR
jgi:hypothetical protein